MEQQLINELIRLIQKMGGQVLINDLIQQVDSDGNMKHWTSTEIRKAYDYIQWQNSFFSRADGISIIEVLLKKYNVDLEDMEPVARSHR